MDIRKSVIGDFFPMRQLLSMTLFIGKVLSIIFFLRKKVIDDLFT